jgi:hypothetical protein
MAAQFLQMLATQAAPPLAALAIISAAIYFTRSSAARYMLDFWFSAAFSVALIPVLFVRNGDEISARGTLINLACFSLVAVPANFLIWKASRRRTLAAQNKPPPDAQDRPRP